MWRGAPLLHETFAKCPPDGSSSYVRSTLLDVGMNNAETQARVCPTEETPVVTTQSRSSPLHDSCIFPPGNVTPTQHCQICHSGAAVVEREPVLVPFTDPTCFTDNHTPGKVRMLKFKVVEIFAVVSCGRGDRMKEPTERGQHGKAPQQATHKRRCGWCRDGGQLAFASLLMRRQLISSSDMPNEISVSFPPRAIVNSLYRITLKSTQEKAFA